MDVATPDDSRQAMNWEGARDNSFVAGAVLTLAEKVAWLEKAMLFASRSARTSSA